VPGEFASGGPASLPHAASNDATNKNAPTGDPEGA
jgi:hypothetical protein